MNDIDLILMKYPYECDAELEQLFKELEKSRKKEEKAISLETLHDKYYELRRENNVN